MMIEVVILSAGSTIIDSDGGSFPLCLADFNGQLLIESNISRCMTIQPKGITIAVQLEDLRRYNLDQIIKVITPDANVIGVRGETGGALCTALLSAIELDPNAELLLINATDLVDIDFTDIINYFRHQDYDAGTVVFSSIHPRYSYVRTDENQTVIEAAEKRPISRNAVAGFFWFRKNSDFIDGAMNLIRKSLDVNGRFYVAPVFNEMILLQKKIGVFPIQKDHYHPFKTERHFRDYETSLERNFLSTKSLKD